MDFVNAKMSELISFYNEHTDKPVKKFTNRATAVKRCMEVSKAAPAKKAAAPIAQRTTKDILDTDDDDIVIPKKAEKAKKVIVAVAKLAIEKAAKKKAAPKEARKHTGSVREKMSEGQRESWKVPEIREARCERSAVEVDGVQFNSVFAAIRDLRLKVSISQGIRFRMRLKEEGKATEFGHKWKIIPLNY